MNHWSSRTRIAASRLVRGLAITSSKFYDWRERYGKVNEHNAQVPRDHWLEDWEKAAILDFDNRYPLEGYRRQAFMMLDQDVVAVSPSSVQAGVEEGRPAGTVESQTVTQGYRLRAPARGS